MTFYLAVLFYSYHLQFFQGNEKVMHKTHMVLVVFLNFKIIDFIYFCLVFITIGASIILLRLFGDFFLNSERLIYTANGYNSSSNTT